MAKQLSSEDFDLLETNGSKAQVKAQDGKLKIDHMKALDKMRSQLEDTNDPEMRQRILNATLDDVMVMADADKTDLLAAIKDLMDYQDSVGLDFEKFSTPDEKEKTILTTAQRNMETAEAAYAEIQAAPMGWLTIVAWRKKRIAKAKLAAEQAVKARQDAQDMVKQMQRVRMENANIEELLLQYANKSRAIVDQLKLRETEIKGVEEGLKVSIVEAQKVHSQALKLKAKVETDLEAKTLEMNREQNALSEIADKQSEPYSLQLAKVTKLEQEVEELKGKLESYTALAASKDSFVHKHNLTIKVLTTIRSNLQTHRTKLNSDTQERVQYYQGYITALKARTDQEFAAILEKLGIKTDETMAKTLTSMYMASQKARQDMMENIPEHERAMADIYRVYIAGLADIRRRDEEIQKTFDDRYGINVDSLFEQYYAKGTTPADEPTEKEGKPVKSTAGGDDLLG